MSVNKWLTLISYQCMKKGSSQQQQTRQISTVNLSSVTSLPKLSKASMSILVSSLLAGLVIVDDSFLLTSQGVLDGLV